jgi:hypothetical protein
VYHPALASPSSPAAPGRDYHAVTTALEEPDPRPKIALDHVGILLGGRHVSMPREQLDGRGRASPTEQLGHEEMPQAVEREPRDPSLQRDAPERLEEPRIAPGLSVQVERHPLFRRLRLPPAGRGEAPRSEPPARARTSAARSPPAPRTASRRAGRRRGRCPPSGAPSLPPPGGPRRPPGRTPAERPAGRQRAARPPAPWSSRGGSSCPSSAARGA